MPRFAANLTMMFNEHAFLDRFDAAATAGFDQVEFLFPYDHPAGLVAERIRRAGLSVVLMNLPAGRWEAGERGIAALPSRADEVRDAFERATPYIRALNVPRVHLMAGIAPNDDEHERAYRDAVTWCAGRAAELGVDIMLEPVNRRDMPGYFMSDVDAAVHLIEELGLPNVRLQLDIYHAQIIHGDVTTRIRRLIEYLGHVQIASVPSRHEPDGEELNYPFLFDELDRLGYEGCIGCEYRPRGRTEEGLGWLAAYGHRAKVTS
ncbi:hydroxypyruvate isomerase [Luteibacter jiangsuensis]|uniref:Hydroxypyruvate isomerase n=1 Tax=Luteibacter jiangsuensis TaxID=637577 RepID=A0ABT9SWN7_9GAMM|nr:2-oxo-tetronate isomerase [Luteibacter jiangsuensis]MDQ0009190.1 hydroxypyruvate isomerase [Luteibacter jiangsuensis]